ncbi:MAG TPA: 3-hydroxyacyl-ACP dehydratase FabZ family protein [Phycisphaerae bacterium]|nr:3-hydroxyacyl-ACP dehydratase FabZ family protein [Phycisphaerae bacterium]
MRWIWIDKFVEFESGRRAVAVKNVTMAEEHLHDHFPGYPIHPPTLMIEGMAQTGGILVGEASDFKEKVILAKVTRATFLKRIVPGDRIRFEAEVVGEIRPEGASIAGHITRDGERVAEIEMMFAHLDQSRGPIETSEENFVFPDDFIQLLRMRQLKELGRGKTHPDKARPDAGGNTEVHPPGRAG